MDQTVPEQQQLLQKTFSINQSLQKNIILMETPDKFLQHWKRIETNAERFVSNDKRKILFWEEYTINRAFYW